MAYTIIENDLLENDNLNIQEQALLIALLSYYNKEKGYSYPSYKKLMKRSKIKQDRTLIKVISSLENNGLITREVKKGVGTKYYLHTSKMQYPQTCSTLTNTVTSTAKMQEDIQQKCSTTITIKDTIKNTKYNSKEIIANYTSNAELEEAINDFMVMRKQIKKPMTDKAIKLMLNELDKLAIDDEEKILILNQSILNSWQGIFPLKQNNNNKQEQQPSRANSTAYNYIND